MENVCLFFYSFGGNRMERIERGSRAPPEENFWIIVKRKEGTF